MGQMPILGGQVSPTLIFANFLLYKSYYENDFLSFR